MELAPVPEPVLTERDHEVWARWMEECAMWSHLPVHKHRVRRARALVEQMMRSCERPYIAWSGGKDSCVIVHLIRVLMGLDVPVMSLVTDLEPPGTLEYLHTTADLWGIDLIVVEPQISFWGWLQEHAHDLTVDTEITRGSTMLGGMWDDTIKTWREAGGYDGFFWGLRKEESRGRRMNYLRRGAVYPTQEGVWRAAPLIEWEGRDVYAYCHTHGVVLPALYQACRFHADDPSRLRKAMWLPGSFCAEGEVVWLRAYYPSLYAKMQTLWSDTSRWT